MNSLIHNLHTLVNYQSNGHHLIVWPTITRWQLCITRSSCGDPYKSTKSNQCVKQSCIMNEALLDTGSTYHTSIHDGL